MTKTATLSAIDPNTFAVGKEIYSEDARAVMEMLNWAITTRPLPHVSLATGDDDWGSTGSLQTLRIQFGGTGIGWHECFRFRIRIASETTGIRVGARCFMAASQQGQVRFTINSVTQTLTTFQNSTNGTEHTAVITGAGTGYQEVLVELNKTVGAGVGYLRCIRVEEEPLVVTALPDPADS